MKKEHSINIFWQECEEFVSKTVAFCRCHLGNTRQPRRAIRAFVAQEHFLQKTEFLRRFAKSLQRFMGLVQQRAAGEAPSSL
jgi:hypothetical protein